MVTMASVVNSLPRRGFPFLNSFFSATDTHNFDRSERKIVILLEEGRVQMRYRVQLLKCQFITLPTLPALLLPMGWNGNKNETLNGLWSRRFFFPLESTFHRKPQYFTRVQDGFFFVRDHKRLLEEALSLSGEHLAGK